jgi:hypothetical protein
LLDYVNVVVHVFRPSFREFYRLEDLWGDADARPVTDEEKLSVAKKPRKRAATGTTKRTGTVKVARTKAKSTKSVAHPRPAKKTVKKAPKSAS